MRRRSSSSLVAACLSAGALHAQVPEAVDPAEIPNYKLIAPGIAAAGQPSPEVLKKIGSMGFKTVLNLRHARRGTAPPTSASWSKARACATSRCR